MSNSSICRFVAGALLLRGPLLLTGLSPAFLIGCGAGSSDEADGAPSFGGLPPGQPVASNGGAGGSGSVGGGGTPNASVGPGNGLGGAVNNGAGGANASRGGAAGEGNGNVTPIPPGNGGASNDGNPGGQAGAGNPPTGGGPFVSVDVNGGASAAFVCPPGPFGDPLAGMGQVQTINAPNNNFSFIEGPVWVGSLGRLFFSDNVAPGTIWQLSAPFTTPSIFLSNSGSNGLAIDNQDQLVVADQGSNRVVRLSTGDPPAVLGTIVPPGNFDPNDVIVRSDDNVYFTSPNDPGRGFYRVAPNGQLSGPFTQANVPGAPNNPNGILLSPDENTLYVSDVFGRFVTSFALLQDGALDVASGEVLVSDTGNLADGMAVDCAGNLYVGTETGVEVYAPNGDVIGDVPTGYASNCTFGGADRRTLFVTSRNALKSVTLGVPGLPD